MSLLKAFCISFSMYSKIPMPQFEWKDKDMRYALCFFPWVGIVIGVLEACWYQVCIHFSIGNICFALVGAAIPIFVSGGFHVDGFMDTCDALHSYQSKEKKLEILKDPHIGAFSVIMLLLYYMIFVGAYSEIATEKCFYGMCFGFAIARALSGITLLLFPMAKKNGSLFAFQSTAQKNTVLTILVMQCVLFLCGVCFFSLEFGILAFVAVTGLVLFYYRKSKKEFGGITGDLAGYFVTLCELLVVICAAVISKIVL